MGGQVSLPEGTVLKGRYRLEKVIGQGGFGITYRAYDVKRRYTCAIKEFFPRGLCRREADTGRVVSLPGLEQQFLYGRRKFDEEVETLQLMQKIPEAVRVWESFSTGSTAFYIMEQLEKPDLKERVRIAGPFPVSRAVQLLTPIARAMHRIHTEFGIIHRDISPENLMFSGDGILKILDFGSARPMKGGNAKSAEFKPGFAPPEQYSDRERQGPYTDVYALGGTFYYMVTGMVLPEALDRMEKETYKPLKQALPECPEYIAEAVDRAVELNAKKRLQTAKAFAEELEAGRNSPKAYLKVLNGEMEGVSWDLPANAAVIVGRSAGYSKIVLGNSYGAVSRQHFVIRFDAERGAFLVTDISTNGTEGQGISMKKEQPYLFSPGTVLNLSGGACKIIIGVYGDGQ